MKWIKWRSKTTGKKLTKGQQKKDKKELKAKQKQNKERENKKKEKKCLFYNLFLFKLKMLSD